jgi:predicted metal-dependent peptidase
MSKEISRAVARARIKMLFNQPFFGSIAMKMGVKITDAIGTFAVDGRDLYVNPTFAATLSEPEMIGVLCHEVLHIANLHHLRKGERDHQRWNMACDYVINPIVLGAEMSLPSDALNDPQYRGMSAERVYDLLPETKGSNGDQPGDGPDHPGSFGEVLDGTTKTNGTKMTAAERQIAENEVKVMVAEAAEAARQQGKLPSSISKMIGEVLAASVNWRDVLRRFVAQTVVTNVSWVRPNRRLIGHGIRIPGAIKNNVGELVIGFDTSGSIYEDPKAAQQYCSEISALVADTKPERIHVIMCDSTVQSAVTYEPDEMPDIFKALSSQLRGGGGTDFRPVFRWVEDNGIDPVAMIYLTDMEGYFPSEPPTYPVLWAKTTDHKAPFGEEVRVTA